MALENCFECGKEISSVAATCPHCGAPGPTARTAQKEVPPIKQAVHENSFSRYALPIIVIVSTIAVLGLGLFLFIRFKHGDKAANNMVATLVHTKIELYSGTLDIPSKSVKAISISLPYTGDLHVEANVVKGDHINLYVVDESDYSRFAQARSALFGGNFRHYPAFHSSKSKVVDRNGRLNEGKYRVILENPTWGILSSTSFDVRVEIVLNP